MAESNWAQRMASELKNKQELEAKNNEALVAIRKIVEAEGPQLWSQIREELKRDCEAFNTEMGERLLTFDVVQNTMIMIRNTRNGNRLEGDYQPSSGLVTLGRQQYQAYVRPGSTRAQLIEKQTSRVSEPSTIATDALTEYIKGNL